MNNLIDLRDVIRDLRFSADHTCVNCCNDVVFNKVADLLGNYVPRVMDLDEVKKSVGRDLYLEVCRNYGSTFLLPIPLKEITDYQAVFDTTYLTFEPNCNLWQYNVEPFGWRCWTARPTEEQRVKAIWYVEENLCP